MVLPQHLYDTSFKFNAWREERLTFGESCFANGVMKAYRKWKEGGE
jgi:hypothetical protein